MSTGSDIAFRIRTELVCCWIYERVNVCRELTLDEAMASDAWHDLCYWSEAAAQIAEGRCPGRETTPNICQCPCEGCKRNCEAHQEAAPVVPESGLACVCGDQVTWMKHPAEPGWIHTPGSDTTCLNASPLCPVCRTEHPLTPGPLTPQDGDAVDIELDHRIEAALQQTGDPDKEQLTRERDTLGRETDRLRKDWVQMRTQAETAEAHAAALVVQLEAARAKVRRMSRSVPALQRALDELPLTCRYHGVRLLADRPAWGHEACCDTGEPALRRQMATRALEALKAAMSYD